MLIGKSTICSHIKYAENFVIKYARMLMVASLEVGLQLVFLFYMPHFVHLHTTCNGKEITFVKRKRSLSRKTKNVDYNAFEK